MERERETYRRGACLRSLLNGREQTVNVPATPHRTFAPLPSEQPAQERDDDADNNAGDDRKVEREISLLY